MQRIFENLGDLINGATGSSLSEFIQPTFGVSFGLPQAGPGYGGYQQNPLGTGPAVNPYYTQKKGGLLGGLLGGAGPNGLSVGGVDVNPLVSFQATTNSNGSVVAKPLINLHVTPNGCGLFGCTNNDLRKDERYPEDSYNYYDDNEGNYNYYGDRRQQVKFQPDDAFQPSTRYQTGTVRPNRDNRYYQNNLGSSNQRPFREDYDHRQGGTVFRHDDDYRPVRQQQLRPDIVEALKIAQKAQGHSGSSRPISFGVDSDDVVVKHEHHHYHHHHTSGNNDSPHIAFGGYNAQFRNGDSDDGEVQFRNADATDGGSAIEADLNYELLEANNVRKRKVSEQDQKQEEAAGSSAFRFPHSRDLKSQRKRRSPDQPADVPEQIQSVRTDKPTIY